MSDSLARLVLRAQGRLRTAEPLLPSRYETVATPGRAGTVPLESAGILPTAHDDDRSALPSPNLAPLRGPSPLARGGNGPRVLVPERERAEGRGHEPLIGAVGTRSLVTPVGQATEAPATRQPTAPIDVAPSASPPPTAPWEVPLSEANSPPARQHRHAARPPRPTSGPAAPHPALSEDPVQPAAPEVRINIGVVEVHALPSRPSSVRESSTRRPGLSLADYLAQRHAKVS